MPEIDSATLCEAIAQGDRNAIFTRLEAVANRGDIEVQFRSDWGSFSNAFRSLAIGDWIAWDADEYKRITFHTIAYSLGMRIATRKHKTISCYVVMRIA